MSVSLHVFGAAGCVTGSCLMVQTSRARVLVDCGLFQGPKTLKQLNYGPFPFDPAQIDAVCLTHAHIDHSGLIPKLHVAGYRGPIFATPATAELCSIMLPDAGAIQEMEVESLNRRNRRHARGPTEPIYTAADAEACLAQFQTTPYDSWKRVAPGMRARWWNAGHILGSASIELEVEEDGATQRLMFSGDLGPGGRDFADDPAGPAGVDHVILESTYGDKLRPPMTQDARRAALRAEALAAHAAGGPLLIPAFAVERTQELLVDLLAMMEANEAPPAPIFLDSPLAIRASDIFLRHAGEGPFSRLRESAWLQFTESAGESRALERLHGWHVIVAASGMCDAGRVRHHLKRLLWREEATVLLVGYQAIGTLGRLLQEGRRSVRIQGDDIKVRARVRMLDVYSGHADADALVAWAKARAPIGGSVILTHGEPENLEGLERRLTAANVADGRVVVAELDQRYRLQPARAGATDAAAPAPRIAPKAVSRLDWHNARSDFLGRLNDALDAAPSDEARELLLAELRARLPD